VPLLPPGKSSSQSLLHNFDNNNSSTSKTKYLLPSLFDNAGNVIIIADVSGLCLLTGRGFYRTEILLRRRLDILKIPSLLRCPGNPLPVLALAYSEHLGATYGAGTLGCRFAILHGNGLGIPHFSLGTALDTICLHWFTSLFVWRIILPHRNVNSSSGSKYNLFLIQVVFCPSADS